MMCVKAYNWGQIIICFSIGDHVDVFSPVRKIIINILSQWCTLLHVMPLTCVEVLLNPKILFKIINMADAPCH